MESDNLFNEIIQEDEILEFHRGRIHVKDCIFEYNNRVEDLIISGDVNPDLSKKYQEVDSDVFCITVGESIIYNKEVNKNYKSYRLINISF